MDDERPILQKAVEWRDAGHGVALATVVSAWGSSPRPVGGHLVVRADGAFAGSVSGGCVESDVVTEALAVVNDGAPRLLEFGVSAWRHGLSCGGKIAVLVLRLTDVEPLRRALAALERGEPAAVGFGVKDGALTALTDTSATTLTNASATTLTEARFTRIYRPPPRLVIAGAVHIAEHLARMAAMTGFATSVFDPRRGFAERGGFERTPFVGWPADYFDHHPLDGRTAVVSLTHTGRIDHPTIVAALRSPAFYIGALGGKATHAKRLARLQSEGFGPQDLQRVHGPVGLPIGARSPAEIAVAILAQLIGAWRNDAGKGLD